MSNILEKAGKLLLIESQIGKLEEAAKILRKELLDLVPDEGIIQGDKKIIRVTKKTYSLKPDVKVEDIMRMFPMAMEAPKPNFKELKTIVDAHKYLVVTQSSYLKIGALSDKGDQDGGA